MVVAFRGADVATIDIKTGGLISGIDEVWQSINIILTTPRGTRVMRRHFGSDLPRLVDGGLSPLTLIDFFAAIADAIRAEPRFKVRQMKLSAESEITKGHAVFDLEGVYYPRGHLGDFSEARDARGSIVMP